jgi:hypothetical protein
MTPKDGGKAKLCMVGATLAVALAISSIIGSPPQIKDVHCVHACSLSPLSPG